MGSPSYCYRKYLEQYVKLNIVFTKYDKIYTDEYLKSLSEEELEGLVKQFNKSHKSYSHFLAGVAVAHCNKEWKDCCDMLNASGCAIGEFMELMGIYEPECLIDFEEE